MQYDSFKNEQKICKKCMFFKTLQIYIKNVYKNNLYNTLNKMYNSLKIRKKNVTEMTIFS